MAVPGPGTVRRWRREAPPGFEFALLGPREIGQEGFRDGKVIETALKTLGEVAKELAAKTAVFVAPSDFPHSRANRAALRDFLKNVKKQFETIVFEPGPAWNPEDVGRPRGRDADPVRARSAASRPVQAQGRVLPPAWPSRSQVPLRRPGDREAGRDRPGWRRTRRDLRLHQRGHVRRRQALQARRRRRLIPLQLRLLTTLSYKHYQSFTESLGARDPAAHLAV